MKEREGRRRRIESQRWSCVWVSVCVDEVGCSPNVCFIFVKDVCYVSNIFICYNRLFGLSFSFFRSSLSLSLSSLLFILFSLFASFILSFLFALSSSSSFWFDYLSVFMLWLTVLCLFFKFKKKREFAHLVLKQSYFVLEHLCFKEVFLSISNCLLWFSFFFSSSLPATVSSYWFVISLKSSKFLAWICGRSI